VPERALLGGRVRAAGHAVRRVVALALVLAACGGGGGAIDDAGVGADASGVGWADVAPILAARCVPCHRDGQIGAFALDTYDAVHARAPLVAAALDSGRMPPFPPSQDDGCAPLADFRIVPPADRARLSGWAHAGAPRGTGGPDVLTSSATNALGAPSLRWPMAEPYTPPPLATRADDYRCFVIDPGVTTTFPVAAMSVAPGARAIAHHAVAYMIAPAQAAQAAALDAADPGPGYTCFGGAMVSPAYLSGIWVPGDASVLEPPSPGVGYWFPAGWQIVLQLHYNVQRSDPAPDVSSVTVWPMAAAPTETPRTLIAGDFGFAIPPHATSYARTASVRFTAAGTSDVPYVSAAEGVIYAATPHMHRLGRDVRMELVHADGTSECVLHVPAWSFDWQGIYRLRDGVRARAGEELRVTCTWSNETGDATVTYGEGSSDEMCLGSVSIWSGG
jgi:hypothetical protein